MNTEQQDNSEAEDLVIVEPQKRKKNLMYWLFGSFFFALLALIAVAFLVIHHLNQPGDNFPSNEIITIEAGTSVMEITRKLEQAGVVQSQHVLYYSLILFHEPTNLKASSYLFEEPITTTEVATRLTEGDFDTDLISFTHFEGERVSQLAKRAAELLPNFSEQLFIAKAEPLEGRLFPDTYFLSPNFDHDALLDLMLETFEEKIVPFQTEINSHSLSLDEILVLASIIEREANTPQSMSLVSSVLQNRMEIGMALQADASIEYVLDKPLNQLTPEDLDIDSPYNTYLYAGLPPTPIGNPGLDSITAVLRPTDSEYFYYITDDTGTFHFAETYDQHLRNINTYLRR